MQAALGLMTPVVLRSRHANDDLPNASQSISPRSAIQPAHGAALPRHQEPVMELLPNDKSLTSLDAASTGGLKPAVNICQRGISRKLSGPTFPPSKWTWGG